MVIAKKIILQLWKSDTVPLFKIWIGDLVGILHMVRYSIMYNLNTFPDICQPFLAHPDKSVLFCLLFLLFLFSVSVFCNLSHTKFKNILFLKKEGKILV